MVGVRRAFPVAVENPFNPIVFRVYGMTVAQGRPRAARLPGGQIRVFDPTKSREWKQHVRAQAALYMADGRVMFGEGPLEMALSFELLRPKSAPKRITMPAKRPDLSNFLKGVEDALRGVCFRDDAQLVQITMDKHFGERPGVAVSIWPVKQ